MNPQADHTTYSQAGPAEALHHIAAQAPRRS
ncbi:MAG: hypothetical protein QOH13_1397 [Thermoleophilaceae bacterium]|jgi:hypothetical protein|nr:hypothetical protein [Thermoleophilaceae bacterium]